MSSSEKLPSDDDLAGLMNENARGSEDGNTEDGFVEGIVPPAISGDTAGELIEEESFSINDFESDLSSVSEDSSSRASSNERLNPPPTGPLNTSAANAVTESSASIKGGVSEFRKTLSNLSRQLEIDRLALLHKTLTEDGQSLPTLPQIAGDIEGGNPLYPEGDCDYYGKRPVARLDGWIAGLSFGANRRAKKFNK